MSKLKDAVKEWEKKHEAKASEATEIKLYGFMPSIKTMDLNTLSTLRNCEKLSLSTNNIEKIGILSGLVKLKILSLGRNSIRKLENLDAVQGTLEQLWLSYNAIEKLTGIQNLKRLRVLYIANNNIASWSEFDRLKDLPLLEDLLFTGNPLEQQYQEKEEWRMAVLKRLPKLKRLDGVPVDHAELEKAQGK
mmetsp:Transcript_9344/g.13833  ORF Transcript_9344/g.13833 Transcript_9344/m.13833 type:complete len:191 (+) Transcript_9344:18-590(+)